MAIDSARQRLPSTEAAELGLLFVAVVAVKLWAAVVAVGHVVVGEGVLLAVVPDDASNLLRHVAWYAVGMGLGAVAYARYRGLPVEFGLPAGGDRRAVASDWRAVTPDRLAATFDRLAADVDRRAVAAVLVPAALVAVAGLAGEVLFDAGVSAFSSTVFSPDVALQPSDVWPLAVVHAVPRAVFGAGYALLVCAAVHGTVRERVVPDRPGHAVWLSTLVAAYVWIATSPVRSVADWVAVVLGLGGGIAPPGLRVGFVLSAAVSVCFGVALGLVYRGISRDSFEDVLELRHGPVLGLGLVGLALGLYGLRDPADAVYAALHVVAFGAAVYGYERTRSLWVPVASLALFGAAVPTVAFVEAALGLA